MRSREHRAPRAPRTASLSPFVFVICCLGNLTIHGLAVLFGFAIKVVDPWILLSLSCFCLVMPFLPFLRTKTWLGVLVQTYVVLLAGLDIILVLPWQVQAVALPLVDDVFRGFDLALGFDHPAWMRWLDTHPVVRLVLDGAYRFMIPQAVVVIALYLRTGCLRDLDRYLAAFMIAIVLTSAVSVLLPTQGIVAILDPALRNSPSWPHSATDVATYDALRSGELRDLSGIPKLGIISFPSFHAASAALSIWSFRMFRPVRLPILVLNLAMSVAAIGCGGHYLADILVGYVVAGAAILLAVRGSDIGYRLIDGLVAWSQRSGTRANTSAVQSEGLVRSVQAAR